MEWINTFEKIGYWELNDNFKSHKVLSHLNLKGINFVINKEKSKLSNVVYVFKTDDEILYIGETTKGIQERFSSYRYGFDKLVDTDNRVKEEITKLLLIGKSIEIYLLQPKAMFKFQNDDIELSISKSLEDYLISTFQPRLNKRENKSLISKMHYQEKMDKLFGKGSLWRHRTLRTLFDPHSAEYTETHLEKKLEIFKTIINNNIEVEALIQDYKDFYIKENKYHVVEVADAGLDILLNNLNK